MTRPFMLHVVKVLLSGVAEREMLCGCACDLKADLVAQSQRFRLRISHMYLVLTDVAQLVNLPRYIRVSNKLCRVEQVGQNTRRSA